MFNESESDIKEGPLFDSGQVKYGGPRWNASVDEMKHITGNYKSENQQLSKRENNMKRIRTGYILNFNIH